MFWKYVECKWTHIYLKTIFEKVNTAYAFQAYSHGNDLKRCSQPQVHPQWCAPGGLPVLFLEDSNGKIHSPCYVHLSFYFLWFQKYTSIELSCTGKFSKCNLKKRIYISIKLFNLLGFLPNFKNLNSKGNL